MFSFMGVFTACEDYDDEINNLQNQITANSDAIADIQALLAKGVVIEKVEKNAEGILLTLSDGTTQQITNGANGADGKDAAVWTIGNDGYWYKDGVKTEYKAVGTDGKDGQDGQDGKDGQDGNDGKDGNDGAKGDKGDVYVPNEDGYFHLNGEKTDIQWATAGVSAAQTETAVVTTNADGTKVTISTVAELKSLVFQPQLVVDGVNAIRAGVLINSLADTIVCFPEEKVFAEYHLNPSSVNEAGIDKASLSYILKTVDYKATRAIEEKSVEASYNSINDGILKVNVKFQGDPSEGSTIDLIALQVKNASGAVITSDYHTIDKSPIESKDLIISRYQQLDKTNTKQVHYWKTKGEAEDTAKLNAAELGTIEQDRRIIEFKYNEELNLDDHVRVCFAKAEDETSHREFEEKEMEAYHLDIVYDIKSVGEVLITQEEEGLKVKTDQQKFIKLNGNKVTATTYEDGDKLRSAIGRTPIVKASLVHNEDGKQTVLDSRYIVLEIIADQIDPDKPELYEYPFDVTTKDHFGAKLHFCNGAEVEITAQDMNTVYSTLGMSKEEFAAEYNFLPVGTTKTVEYWDEEAKTKKTKTFASKVFDADGALAYKPNDGQIASFGLTWTLSAKYIWNNAGKDFTPKAVAVYEHKDNNKMKNSFVVIYLEAAKAIPALGHDVANDAEKISIYWKEWNGKAMELAQFNVRVPNVGEEDSTKCVFVNNILTLFKEGKDPLSNVNRAIAGSIYTDKPINPVTGWSSYGVSSVETKYVFKDASCTGQATPGKFKISNDGQKLYYVDPSHSRDIDETLDLPRLVATIDVVAEDTINVILNDNQSSSTGANAIAEELLNTNNLHVVFDIRAEFESCLGTLPIPRTKDVSFEVQYVRPINVAKKSANNFKDALDFGVYPGTLLKVSEVVKITDWRDKDVLVTNSYWDYYRIVGITVDNSKVKCDATDNGELPLGVKAGIVNEDAKKDADLNSILNPLENNMWFFYKNNGNVLQEDMKLYFPVTITYWWGKVVTQTVEVTVEATDRSTNIGD